MPKALRESATGFHVMGYCKHEWQPRSEQLRAVFGGFERTVQEFYVCKRCLRIREVDAESQPTPRKRDDEGSNAA